MSKTTSVSLNFWSTDLFTFTKMQIPESCLNTDIYAVRLAAAPEATYSSYSARRLK